MNDNSKTFESTYFSESFLVKSNTAQKKPERQQIKIENDKINLKNFLFWICFYVLLKTSMKAKQNKYIKIKDYGNNLDKDMVSNN